MFNLPLREKDGEKENIKEFFFPKQKRIFELLRIVNVKNIHIQTHPWKNLKQRE